MSFSITIENFGNYTIVVFCGVITADDISNTQKLLFAKEEYRESPNLVMDLTSAVFRDGIAGAIKVGMKTIENRDFDTRANVALVLPREHLKELAEIFKTVTVELPITIEMADSLPEAIQWVQSAIKDATLK